MERERLERALAVGVGPKKPAVYYFTDDPAMPRDLYGWLAAFAVAHRLLGLPDGEMRIGFGGVAPQVVVAGEWGTKVMFVPAKWHPSPAIAVGLLRFARVGGEV